MTLGAFGVCPLALRLPKPHPCNSAGILVLVQDSAQMLVSSNLQLGDLVRFVIGGGNGRSGWAFAMP
jgi:hypothetical protein